MNLLQQKIIKKIRNEGPITFKTFMEMALYEPELGYYTSKKTKIGKRGDFYTSPHLHPMFGAMIGRQMEEMWEIMGRPSDFKIIEMGAGEGYLCNDMLDYLRKQPIFNSLKYIIVELNPALKKNQKKMLRDFRDRVEWVSTLGELKNIKGCFVSNELSDSFPVHLIEMEDEIQEIFVDVKDEKLIEIKKTPSTDEIIEYLKEFFVEPQQGYRTEINLKIREWLSDINNMLSEGFLLTIDYGYSALDYYSEDRNRGTLLCYHKHQVTEDPYQNIGEQDITAHINFSSLKKWGEELGIKTIGFCQQGTYLMALGIDDMINQLHKASSEYSFEIAKIKKLILPGTIGETHKVLIQYKGKADLNLTGFSLRNQKEKL